MVWNCFTISLKFNILLYRRHKFFYNFAVELINEHVEKLIVTTQFHCNYAIKIRKKNIKSANS